MNCQSSGLQQIGEVLVYNDHCYLSHVLIIC